MTHIPPSLGTTGLEIWQAWRALRSGGGTYVIDGRDVCGGGTYFHRDGKLYRSFPFTRKAPATYREATPAENDDVFDAIECGAFQITEHGPDGLAQKWSHGMPVKVHHQATGRAIPGSAAEKRLHARMKNNP